MCHGFVNVHVVVCLELFCRLPCECDSVLILNDSRSIETMYSVRVLWIFYRYYPALKTLEQLEHTYLPRIKRYCQCLARTVQ